MVATSVLSLCDSSFVHFESLEMEYSGRPTGSTTTALVIFAPLLETLSSIEGRSLYRVDSTNDVFEEGVGEGALRDPLANT